MNRLRSLIRLLVLWLLTLWRLRRSVVLLLLLLWLLRVSGSRHDGGGRVHIHGARSVRECVRGGLRRLVMCVERAVLGRRAAARACRGEGAGAALQRCRQARRRIRDLERQALDGRPLRHLRVVVLRLHLVVGGGRVRVHRRHARVVVVSHIVRVVVGGRHGLCPLQLHVVLRRLAIVHGRRTGVRRVAARQAVPVLRDLVMAGVAVGAHVRVVVVEGLRPVKRRMLGHERHRRWRRPRGGHGPRGRWRLAAVRLRRAVVQLRGVHPPLMRSPLVLHHGRLAAEALEAALMRALVWPLASVDSPVARKR